MYYGSGTEERIASELTCSSLLANFSRWHYGIESETRAGSIGIGFGGGQVERRRRRVEAPQAPRYIG